MDSAVHPLNRDWALGNKKPISTIIMITNMWVCSCTKYLLQLDIRIPPSSLAYKSVLHPLTYANQKEGILKSLCSRMIGKMMSSFVFVYTFTQDNTNDSLERIVPRCNVWYPDLTGFFIVLQETQTSRERSNPQQEQTVKKKKRIRAERIRGIKTTKAVFEKVSLKWRVFNWTNYVEKSPIINTSGKQNIIHKICGKNVWTALMGRLQPYRYKFCWPGICDFLAKRVLSVFIHILYTYFFQ